MVGIILSPNAGLDAFEARGDFVGVGAGATSSIAANQEGVCDGFVSSVRGSVLRGAGRSDDG